jgi:hypothetical protein
MKAGVEPKLDQSGKQNPKYVDLLEEDKPIAGQKFVCVSFVSPDKILKQQEHFINTDASVIKINSNKYYHEFKNKKNNTNITKGIYNLIKWNISKFKK